MSSLNLELLFKEILSIVKLSEKEIKNHQNTEGDKLIYSDLIKHEKCLAYEDIKEHIRKYIKIRKQKYQE